MAKILDGRALALAFRKQISDQVPDLKTKYGREPGLAVVLVGDDPASLSYVKSKEKIAVSLGFKSFDYKLSRDISQDEIQALVHELNSNQEVDGILVQLPIPQHLDTDKLLAEIEYRKDADGLHPINQGALFAGKALVQPCTPKGVMHLIDLAYCNDWSGDLKDLNAVDLSGKRAVVLGRSRLVGKPVADLLISRNATVTILHSKSSNPETQIQEADILVSATGQPGSVHSIKSGAVVIDVGITRNEEGKLVGDVDFDKVEPQAKAITPVPGGVGPMTVAMLMQNTFELYQHHQGKE